MHAPKARAPGIIEPTERIATGLDQQCINVRGSLGDNLLPINVASYMPDRASTLCEERVL